MGKMTKTQINERQLEIMDRLDVLDQNANVREAKIRTLTSEEQKEEREKLMAEQRAEDMEYDKLTRESSGLSARAKARSRERRSVSPCQGYGHRQGAGEYPRA